MNILRKLPRISLVLSILFIIWLAIAMFGAKFGLIDRLFAFGTMTIGGGFVFAAIIGLLAAAGLLIALFSKPRQGVVSALISLAISAAFFGGVFGPKGLQSTSAEYPFIYDITTNPADAPQFSEALVNARTNSGENINALLDFDRSLGEYDKWAENEELKSKTAGQLIAQGYPDLKTLGVDRSPADSLTAIKDAMEMRGFENVTLDEDAGTVEGTAVVFWYGFEDDVVGRVRATETGSSVDFRSTSRVGTSDLGVNAGRIADLGKAVKDRLAKDFPKMDPMEVIGADEGTPEDEPSVDEPSGDEPPEDERAAAE